MDPVFFPSAKEWRAWLQANHASRKELPVGFYKTDSGKPSMTWPESVDEALCFGWIDGVRRRIDSESYTIRFTPRKSKSNWSIVNIRRMEQLTAQGLAHAAGIAAFEARSGERSGVYSFEQKDIALEPGQEKLFRANPKGWEFFQAQPPWYRRTAAWWVISAKREETKAKRLATLIADSASGRKIKELDRTPK